MALTNQKSTLQDFIKLFIMVTDTTLNFTELFQGNSMLYIDKKFHYTAHAGE